MDAFAGTGYRTSKNDVSEIRRLLDFPEANEFVKGSARLALEVEPAFDRYVFVEKNRRKLSRLFAGVGKPAVPLRNSKGVCMYHLVFACGNPNPRAKALALKIAEHILKG